AAMQDPDASKKTLTSLHERGIRIVIDDFGSGYSSMQRRKGLPLDAIKIDRVFLEHAAEDRRDAAIVAAVIAMSKSLDIEVVAEGVETPEQLQFLRTLRCRGVQGYLFGRPIPADQIERYFV